MILNQREVYGNAWKSQCCRKPSWRSIGITIFIRIAEATRKWSSSESLVIPSYTFLPVVFLYQGAIRSWLGLCYRVYIMWKLSSMLRLSGSVAAFSHPQTLWVSPKNSLAHQAWLWGWIISSVHCWCLLQGKMTFTSLQEKSTWHLETCKVGWEPLPRLNQTYSLMYEDPKARQNC